MNNQEKNLLIEFCKSSDDVLFIESYFGRNSINKACVALKVPIFSNLGGILMQLGHFLSVNFHGKLYKKLSNNVKFENSGMNIIIYFPNCY